MWHHLHTFTEKNFVKTELAEYNIQVWKKENLEFRLSQPWEVLQTPV